LRLELDKRATEVKRLASSRAEVRREKKYLEDELIRKDEKLKILEQLKRSSELHQDRQLPQNLFGELAEDGAHSDSND